jgi:hypothetical protein
MKERTYKIYNKKDNENYFKTFNTNSDCYHWIVNHLDLSKEWSYDYKERRLVTCTRKINKELINNKTIITDERG